MKDRAYLKDNYTIANKIRKEELLLSIALSEYKQVIFDILTPTVESAKTVLPSVQKDKKIRDNSKSDRLILKKVGYVSTFLCIFATLLTQQLRQYYN